MGGSIRLTADGYASPEGRPVRVFNVIVKSEGTAAVVALLNGDGGDQYDQIDGTIDQAVIRNYEGGIVFPDGLYVNVDANTEYVVANLEVIQ